MNDLFELDEDARAVLSAGREAHHPTDARKARVRGAIQEVLAADAGLAGEGASPIPRPFRSMIPVRRGVMLAAAATAAATVAAAGWYGGSRWLRYGSSAPPPEAHPAEPALGVLGAERMGSSSAAEASAAEASAVGSSAAGSPAAGSSAAGSHAVEPMPTTSAVHEEAPSVRLRTEERGARAARRSDDLPGEIALLAQANAATNAGDADRALALLQQYDRRYGAGALREERAAAGVLALCAADRIDAARAAAEHFRKRWPRSPLSGRIAASCAGRDPRGER